jgi:hypothetical protein
MATAANSGGDTTDAGADDAKPQAERTSAAMNDDKQGFAASANDDKVDAKEIPDPAGFGEEGAADEAQMAGGAKSNGNGVVANVTVNRPAAKAASPGGVAPVSASVAPSNLNPLLVAGVPLGAAVLLMGIYWLILRAGAV